MPTYLKLILICINESTLNIIGTLLNQSSNRMRICEKNFVEVKVEIYSHAFDQSSIFQQTIIRMTQGAIFRRIQSKS